MGERFDGFDRDLGKLARRQGLDAMIGHAKQRILQVDEIAGHVNRQDLAAAIPDIFIPDAKARQDEPGVSDAIPFTHDRVVALCPKEGVRES
jgi:hypothetical protein